MVENIIPYFNLIGAIVAIILGVLKAIDLFNDGPRLIIEHGLSSYWSESTTYRNSDGKKKLSTQTKFSTTLNFVNKGRKPITIIKLLVNVLKNGKELMIGDQIYSINKKLDVQEFFEYKIELDSQLGLPKSSKYALRINMITSDAKKKKIIPVSAEEELEEKTNNWVQEELNKGKII